MISILIPAKNEERDLPGCLASVQWSDDIHVYDCYSADRTVAVAKAAGAHVIQRTHEDRSSLLFAGNEAEHKNWALRNIPFKYPWVFHLDADERATPELASAMRRAVAAPGDKVVFRVRRRDFLRGAWLRHAQASPFYLRLFLPQKIRYERLINPVTVPGGPVGEVDGFLDHFPFSKGIAQWLERHNSYSTLEARQIARDRAAHASFSLRQAFLASDFHQRRFHQKELFSRLPGRPLLKFLLLYFAKRGFLDGRAGLTYALLQSFYEYLIVLKARELESGPEPAAQGSAEVCSVS